MDNAQRVFGGLYHRTKFRWNRCSSFNNMQVLIFNAFGLKMHIHTPNGGLKGLYPKNGSNLIAIPKGQLLAYKYIIRRVNCFLRAVQPFLHSSPFYPTPKSYALQWATHSSNSARSHESICTPNQCMVPLLHATQHAKRHLDRFSHFCTA